MKKRILILFRKCLSLTLKILPMLFWLLLIFGFDLPYIAICTILCAVIHEMGHIYATLKLTGGFSMKGVISGFRLSAGRQLSYREEMIIAAAGPLINIAVFLILSPFIKIGGEYIATFALLNLFTAISNLLPVEGYDGYRILECFFARFSFSDAALAMLRRISFIFILIFAFLSLYFIRSFNGGYWVFFIFIAILIKTIKKDEKVFFARKREKKRGFKRF